jgi:hypothetical protein
MVETNSLQVAASQPKRRHIVRSVAVERGTILFDNRESGRVLGSKELDLLDAHARRQPLARSQHNGERVIDRVQHPSDAAVRRPKSKTGHSLCSARGPSEFYPVPGTKNESQTLIDNGPFVNPDDIE